MSYIKSVLYKIRMTAIDVIFRIADDVSQGYREFCTETDTEMIREKGSLMGSILPVFNSYFFVRIVVHFFGARGFDLYSRDLRPFTPFLLLLFCVFLIGGQLVLALFAMEWGPYGHHSQKRQIYKVGCLYKSVAEVGALCIAVNLRYSFAVPFLCFFWISSVAVLQNIWKLRYGPCDFWFSDVLLGSIMRAVIVYQDYDESLFMAMYLFYGLIIYHRHWCSPSSTTIFSKTEDVPQIQEPNGS